MLISPQGRFVLHRDQHDPSAPLRAWDAADEYALEHLGAGGDGLDAVVDGRWLVVNDGFGALAVALAAHRPVSWSDSVVAIGATADNLRRNDIVPGSVTFVPSTSVPDGPFDVVIVKVPRTTAFLADQLARLRPVLHASSVVIGAGMTRTVHRSTIEAFESCIGPTPTTRARKKARLLLATVADDLRPTSTEPATFTSPDGIVVTSLPNVFSAGALDDGTRLLLEHLPSVPAGRRIVDLGCGNGVVAATIARRNPGTEVVCCDESYQAVESARRTVGPVTADATFHAVDVLHGIEDDSVDLVVVNPPFHAAGARTTDVAHRMFGESRRVLRPDGELWVVANRHLGHHVALRRVFGGVDVVASDPRFVLLRSRVRP